MSLHGNSSSFLPSPLDSYSSQMSGWATFDAVWTQATGYRADNFEFTPGMTPIATFKETAAFLVVYYITIFGGREVMRPLSAFQLKTPTLVHNFALSLLSGVLLVLFLEQLVPDLWNHGTFHCICDKGGWSKQLETLYYLNYLMKYIELTDTVFLVLKKKPLTFLHTYHHGATALLCYTQLAGQTPVSWVPIMINLAVHVVMYWYYFQSARGVRVSWKKWITRMQIAQFVVDLGFIYFATWNLFVSKYAPELPHVGPCKGSEIAAFTGCAILSSYLVLFIGFYFATYDNSPKSSKARKSVISAEVGTRHSNTIRAISDGTIRAKDMMHTSGFKSMHGNVAGD